MSMNKILIIEDSESVRKMLCETLKEANYRPIDFNNGQEALIKIKTERMDVVITDLNLPDMKGLDILREVKKTNPLIPIIIITAYGSIELAVEAMKKGAYDFIAKPFDTEHLVLLIERAIERSRLMADNLILKEEFAKKIGGNVDIVSLQKANKIIADYKFIINSTSIGMKNEPSALSTENIGKDTIVYDIVYQPINTDLVKKSKENGATIIYGYEMLLSQAARAFEIWHKIEPPYDATKKALLGGF